jgi:hypothetical protein
MRLISHRGNINGPNPNLENEPKYIANAISQGYEVEVDIWFIDNVLYLGHDKPQHSVDFRWFRDRITKLWIHCKNIEAVVFFKECGYDINYFWHEEDTLTLTSQNHLWAYPGKQPIKNSIAVMPEINNDNISQCSGICSDFIKNYK